MSRSHSLNSTNQNKTREMKMKSSITALILICFLSAQVANAANVVFVHGLLGFGPSELLGLGYWGFWGIGGTNYLNKVKDCGWFSCTNNVYYASVGPVSSNWDRACELYAQIMGTKVDYGYWHSQQNNHARFGKDYSGNGFFPQWGTSNSNKLALIGHSMGGQTIRMLEFLLQKGATMSGETNYPAGVPPPSPLFTGSNRHWIKSVHTIATPHNGSPLHTALGGKLMELLKNVLFFFGSLVSLTGNTFSWAYDFDLDHFSPLYLQQPGESSSVYFDRMFTFFNNSVFDPNFKDLAHFDMGPEYAFWINSRTELTYPETYYFAHSTAQTSAWGSNHLPDWDAEVLMAPTAIIIGAISDSPFKCQTNIVCNNQNTWCQPNAGSSPVSFCWWGQETGANMNWEWNDGLVPRRSSRGPEIGVPPNKYVAPRNRDAEWEYTVWPFWKWTWAKGKWYERFHERDHLQVIGLRFNIFEPNAADGTYDNILEEINFAFESSSCTLARGNKANISKCGCSALRSDNAMTHEWCGEF